MFLRWFAGGRQAMPWPCSFRRRHSIGCSVSRASSASLIGWRRSGKSLWVWNIARIAISITGRKIPPNPRAHGNGAGNGSHHQGRLSDSSPPMVPSPTTFDLAGTACPLLNTVTRCGKDARCGGRSRAQSRLLKGRVRYTPPTSLLNDGISANKLTRPSLTQTSEKE
jgi:hypothetical protein